MAGRLFIFGLGYCGLEIAKLARAAGWSVAGTCRTSEKADELNQQGFEAHLFDGTAALPAEAFGRATHVLSTIAPGTTGDPALKTSARVLRDARW
ncbi:MAG: SDR family NAD(P)-dependent oxidoreductase, partial [Dehalococcoidia bacterium]|nr:SDR family NAD(P)-dependent oxidoreductase [Dehalococcoidia bacterium]